MEREAMTIQEDTEQRLAECERQLKRLGDFLEKYCPKQLAQVVAEAADSLNEMQPRIVALEDASVEDCGKIAKLRRKMKKCKKK